MSKEERQVCPRRVTIPTKLVKEYDLWERTRWSGDEKWIKWPEELGTPPRTCSYCGCAHPDDVIQLIENGWEIDPSTKQWKWYINPPGNQAHCKRLRKAIGDDEKMEKALKVPHYVVTPPVKLYGQHTSEEQRAVLNSLLDRQKQTGEA